MSYNSIGFCRASREQIMRAFDRLPPEVRKALADAVDNFVPMPFQKRLRNGDDVESVVLDIEIFNAMRKAKITRALENGTYARWPFLEN